MKNKSKHARAKKIKEFHYHNVEVKTKNGKIKKIKHPVYAFLQTGNVLVYITISHSRDIPHIETVELRTNPNPKDKRKAFRIKRFYKDTLDTFGVRKKEWKINPLDDEDIRNEYKDLQKTKIKDDSADQDES